MAGAKQLTPLAAGVPCPMGVPCPTGLGGCTQGPRAVWVQPLSIPMSKPKHRSSARAVLCGWGQQLEAPKKGQHSTVWAPCVHAGSGAADCSAGEGC